MKQHITKEQWDELNKQQKRKWLIKMDDFWIKLNYSDEEMCEDPEYHSPNIGQMIEFLGDDLENMEKLGRAGWNLTLYKQEGVWEQELCDALWGAVKHKLNNS